MNDDKRKAELIKKALTIVDELAELETMDDIIPLIEQAEKLKKDRLWKLK